MSNQWRRRSFVKSVVASATLPWHGCGGGDGDEQGPSAPESSDVEAYTRAFPQGLGSGDPRPDGVLLWTRVEPDDSAAEVLVRWYVGADAEFEQIVTAGEVMAQPDVDHTVRVRLEDLEPYTDYYYRFTALLAEGEITAETGRTRTAPLPDADVAVRIALTSCQEYVGRWYHAWRILADEEDVDFVLFVGDYIYETIADPRFQPLDSERSLSLPDGLSLDGSDTNLAALTLADYRALYRQYRADPDLRRAHARFPFVIAWDDHEFTNDGWQDVANEFDGLRGEERNTARREAATRAWHEYLPVDLTLDRDAGFPNDIVTYRSLRYGQHVELVLSDVRYYRDDHLVPEAQRELLVGKFIPNSSLGSRTFARKEGFDELEAESGLTMLGAEQRDWLISAITTSTATWKFWASALMVAQLRLDLRELEEAPALFKNEFYFKVDQWDGFRSERATILSAVAPVENLVVLSGDLHGNYASELRVDFDDPSSPAIAAEFTVTGISSISLQEQLDLFTVTDPTLSSLDLGGVTALFDSTLRDSGPHFRYANSAAYGYAIVDVLQDVELLVRFEEIADVRQASAAGERRRVMFRLPAGTSTPLEG